MKLLQIKDYLLLIDEEAEIKMNDYCVNLDNRISHLPMKVDRRNIGGYGSDKYFWAHKKIIAYYPLNSEAKELDLPLLPNPFGEDDAEKEFNRRYKNFIFDDVWDETLTKHGFIEGYKTAQSKQFSLEDMKKAFEAGWQSRNNIDSSIEDSYDRDFNDIIQSLSTQQLPKEFIPEYDIIHTDHAPNGFEKLLKFKTNSEGKKEIQGTYKY